MKLGKEKQEELENIFKQEVENFLNENAIDYLHRKKLTQKKAELIYEYTKFLMNRISGKTV